MTFVIGQVVWVAPRFSTVHHRGIGGDHWLVECWTPYKSAGREASKGNQGGIQQARKFGADVSTRKLLELPKRHSIPRSSSLMRVD